MDEFAQFQRVVSGDPQVAASALRVLEPRIKGFLWRYLGSLLPRDADREDAIAEVFAKLWAHRERIQVLSLGACWRYLAVMARRVALDMIGDNRFETLELDEAGTTFIDRVAENRLAQWQLYRTADRLWIGVCEHISEIEQDRRLLAAQLHYLEGRSWKDIVEILHPAEEITRETLDEWLLDPATLRLLALKHVYRSNESLAALLLGREISDLPRHSDAGDPEEQVILLRFLNGLLREKIVQMLPDLAEASIDAIVERCKKNLPYSRLAKEVEQSYRRLPCESLLSDQGLIRRLVFQYHVADNLPQKQILERCEPVADAWGQKLTDGMLNVWISNGRLFTQLVKFLSGEQSDET